MREKKVFDKDKVWGCYNSTVGIISLGMVGRGVVRLLKNLEVKVIAYDPYVSKEEAERLGVELVSLEEIFRRAEVVSVHTPWLKETENMIRGDHLRMMKRDAAFINTARGAVVCEKEMIEVLQERRDLYAVLDVTYPQEPPADDSALWDLPNVILTPHIAGVVGAERLRMGEYMVEELRRYIKGEPLKWRISEEQAIIMA